MKIQILDSIKLMYKADQMMFLSFNGVSIPVSLSLKCYDDFQLKKSHVERKKPPQLSLVCPNHENGNEKNGMRIIWFKLYLDIQKNTFFFIKQM